MADVIVCRDNFVFAVKKPGDPSFDTYTVGNGDQIESTTYTPSPTQNPLVPAGTTYDCLKLTHPDGTQAFLQLSTPDPNWLNLLKTIFATVLGIGVPGPNTLRESDTYTLTASGNPLGLTFDVYRNGQPVGTFSCLVPGNPPMP